MCWHVELSSPRRCSCAVSYRVVLFIADTNSFIRWPQESELRCSGELLPAWSSGIPNQHHRRCQWSWVLGLFLRWLLSKYSRMSGVSWNSLHVCVPMATSSMLCHSETLYWLVYPSSPHLLLARHLDEVCWTCLCRFRPLGSSASRLKFYAFDTEW